MGGAGDLDDLEVDDGARESGAGILEFTAAKAGQDVTPANFNFPVKDERRRLAAGGLPSFAGSAWGGNSMMILFLISVSCFRNTLKKKKKKN